MSRIPWLLPYVLFCEVFILDAAEFCFILQCCVVLEDIKNFSYCCFPSLDIVFLFLTIRSENFLGASCHSNLPLSVYFFYCTALDQQFCARCTSVLMSGSHNPSCWLNTYPHPALWPTFLISYKYVAATLNKHDQNRPFDFQIKPSCLLSLLNT